MSRIPQLYRFKRSEKFRPKTIRRIWCLNCDTCLAEEVSDDMTKTAYEWRSRPFGVWIQGKWWGNQFQCFRCGAEGRFPLDKPVSLMEGKEDGKAASTTTTEG